MVNNRKQQRKIVAYRCKTAPLRGHRFVDVMPKARQEFRTLQKRTKRRPYVRSTYFKKDKIFFDYFWQHMQQKLPSDRARRLRYFSCALELLRKSHNDPITFMDPTQPGMFIHRFLGVAPDGQRFWVIVKESRRTNKKQLLSLFPYK